jgi:hypothetical protein
MPLGNGDLAVNLWVQADGAVVFYLAKSDAWSENARLLKLGRVRMSIDPNPFGHETFRQTLDARRGEVSIVAGEGAGRIEIHIWVDANAPVAWVEVDSASPVRVRAEVELWRTAERTLSGVELHSAYGQAKSPDPVIVRPDIVLPPSGGRVMWCHRNEASIWGASLKLQGLEAWGHSQVDPLMGRTFGAAMEGKGMSPDGPTRLICQSPSRSIRLAIHALTAQTDSVQEWMRRLDDQINLSRSIDSAAAKSAHDRWWKAFWDRSHILVGGAEAGEAVTRGYGLQRFITACAGRGKFPIRFNGSLFTVDAQETSGERFDADYRRWGSEYAFQNTRLIYWSMFASGDFEMTDVLFEMYLNALPLARERTRLYFGHDGICFPESISFWGGYMNDNYGWDRVGKPLSHVDNRYIRHYWSGMLELCSLGLERYVMTNDRAFVHRTLLPLVDGVLAFYDGHYPRNEAGKIRFEPAQSLETWWEAVDPLPEIAGLMWVLDGLLGHLGEPLAGAERRENWRRLRGELPSLPMSEDGRYLLPARQFAEEKNVENPELYAVFPYRLFGAGRPGLEMGRETFRRRKHKEGGGWQQNPIQAALLGLGEAAKEMVVRNFTTHNPTSRFEAFWGPNYDWVPDQDHGGVAMMALQSMLVQAVGSKIYLLPAWPGEWDVDFKLRAAGGTTIHCVYRKGKIERMEVDPPERRGDVIGP